MAPAMEAEFDDVAGWTADAVERLGEGFAIPAACRGSADPAALAWLAEACELRPGARLLDVGAGLGGPAAWAAERFGVRPVLVEPMPTACRAAARLFGLPVIAADGRRIPLRAGSADAAWCLGVLDTVRDQAGLLREIHRVLVPGAPLGLLVVVARRPSVPRAPEGNLFPTERRLAGLLAAAGFERIEQIDRPGGPPLSWTRRAERVAAAVAAEHRGDRAHALAADQAARFARLFASGEIAMRLVHAVRCPVRRPSVRPMRGGDMSTPSDDPFLDGPGPVFEMEFETEVEAELTLAESSGAEQAAALPAAEWLFDPTDVEREEIGLRDLLGAAEELERAPHPGAPGGPRSSGPSGPSEAPGTGENA